jgi:hypothetical protein
MLIKIRNPIESVKEKSALADDVDAGERAISILNTSGFADNDYILIGKMGEEQTELIQISTVSGSDTLNLSSNLSHNHTNGTPISVIPYDVIEFSRRTTPTGAFAVLSTQDIRPDNLETVLEDTAGQAGYYYRARFQNSHTGNYSDYSGIIPATGFSTKAVKAMIDTVLRRTEDTKGDFTTREQVKQDLNYAYQEIINALIQASSEYYLKRIEIPTEDYQHEYTLPADFREIKEIRDGSGNIVKPVPRTVQWDGEKGYELTGVNTVYLNSVPQPPADSSRTPITVMGNNSVTEDGTWVENGDAQSVSTDLDEYKVGTGSISFDIDVSGGNEEAGITNGTMTAQDLSEYDESGRFRYWVYIPNVTHITSVTLQWGTDSSNYWEVVSIRDYNDKALRSGWNLIEASWSEADETGSPDNEDVGFMGVTVQYGVNQIDTDGFRVDAIRLSTVWDDNSVYEISYLRQPDQLVSEMDEVELPPGNQSLLVDYAVAQILLRKGERDTLADRLLRNFERARARFIAQSAKRTRRMIGMRPFGRVRNYHHRGASSTRTVVHSDGSETRLK